MQRSSHPATHLSTLLLLLVALAPPVFGSARKAADESAPGDRFAGAERVTAVDLLVDLPPAPLRLGFGAPKPDDFVARVDGVEHPVVGVDPPPRRQEAPWDVVVYFDLAISDRVQTAWAAALLWERLDELTDLGTVELVVADPEPRTVVSPTRDTGRLGDALARLDLRASEAGPEDLLVSRRLAFLEETESLPGTAAEAVANAETALVRERLDALLLAAVDRATAGRPGGGSGTGGPPRRLLLLSTGGWDPVPGVSGVGRRSLDPMTTETARTLVAYGWTVVPLLAPPAPGPVPGIRIGKWRIGRPVIGVVGLPLLTAVRETDRDPERARAWLELARARSEGGETEGARDAAERALVHFADDPRTASEQAEALTLLARLHRALGEPQLARRAVEKAAARDPRAVAQDPAVMAALRHPERAMGTLAGTTLGAVARDGDQLRDAVERAGRRGLVSIQLVGLPDGRLHPAAVERPDGDAVRSAGWVRFGTPETVAAARARRLLDDVAPSGDQLPVTAAIDPARGANGETGGLVVHVRADLSRLPTDEGTALLRTTVAVPGAPGGAEGRDAVVLPAERVEPVPRGPWGWQGEYRAELSGAVPWAVVLVEDLLSDRWGATLVEPEDRR